MDTRESPRRKKARGLLLRHGYAVGGHVKQAVAAAVHKHERHDHKGKKLTKLRRGGAAEGGEPRLRADKPLRAAGGRAKKAGTKIIIVNGHPPIPGPGAGMPMPHPVPVPMGAAPTAPLPVAARPPMAQPMPGAAPPGLVHAPMAQRGGRMGARPHMTAGSKNALGRLQKMRAYGHPSSNRVDE
jgi:hypothetical protein